VRIIIEEPAEPPIPPNAMAALAGRLAGDEFVFEPLMISFAVVVLDERRNHPAEMPFAERVLG
jgi:hypothetical protein